MGVLTSFLLNSLIFNAKSVDVRLGFTFLSKDFSSFSIYFFKNAIYSQLNHLKKKELNHFLKKIFMNCKPLQIQNSILSSFRWKITQEQTSIFIFFLFFIILSKLCIFSVITMRITFTFFISASIKNQNQKIKTKLSIYCQANFENLYILLTSNYASFDIFLSWNFYVEIYLILDN